MKTKRLANLIAISQAVMILLAGSCVVIVLLWLAGVLP